MRHIREKILSYPGVLGTHDLMVHDYGPGRQFASAHVEMAAETDPMESHDTLDNIEQAFKDEDGLIVTLHYDPIVTDDPGLVDMRNRIDAAAKSIDARLSIHDVRCVPGPTHTNVIFDCLRPEDCALSAAQIRERLAALVVEAVAGGGPQDHGGRGLRERGAVAAPSARRAAILEGTIANLEGPRSSCMAEPQTITNAEIADRVPDIVIITGMSGSGRTQAMHVFED